MHPRKTRHWDRPQMMSFHCHYCFVTLIKIPCFTRHSYRTSMNKVLKILLWTLLTARAAAVPISLYGLNYNTRQGPDWDWDKCKSREQVLTDLALLQTLTGRIRILSLVDCGQGYLVLDVAKELGLKVFLGLWVSADENVFLQEKAILEEMLNQGIVNDDIVLGISVGSEALYRKEVKVKTIIQYRAQVKELCVAADLPNLPVSIVDIAPLYIQYPQLISAVDVVVTNSFPFWENIAIDDAAAYLERETGSIRLQAEAQNKEMIMGETGWPSDGFNPDTALASPELQTAYFQSFFCRMDKELNWAYYYFTGIDNAWRREQDPNNTIEGNFGFFYADLTMKPHFRDLVFTCPGSSVEYSFLEIGDPATRDPATSRPPTHGPVSSPASCSSHNGCEALGGNCCPTDAGLYLGCCDATTLPPIATTVSPTTPSPTASPTKPIAVTETNAQTALTQSPTGSPIVASTESPTLSQTGFPTFAETEAPVASRTESPTGSPVFVSSAPLAESLTEPESPTVSPTEFPLFPETESPVAPFTESLTGSPVVVSTAPLAASLTKPPSAPSTSATDAPTRTMSPAAIISPTNSPSSAAAPNLSTGASPSPAKPPSSASPGKFPSASPASIPSAADLPSLFQPTSDAAVVGPFWYGSLVASIIFFSWLFQ